MAAAAIVAALSACSPFVPSPLSSQQHVKPTTHRATTPATHTPAPSPTASAPPSVKPTTSASASDAYEARILVLVNAERAKAGLSKVTANSCADGFAESWAPKIQHDGALSHQSLQPILSSCHASTVGENVAYGNVTADEMMTMWMNSTGHRANILNPHFTGIGIAAVTDSSGRWYGVQDFVG